MLERQKNLTRFRFYFMLPSCVPATDLDESGAVLLNAEQLRFPLRQSSLLGLAELMNAYGTGAL